MIAFRNFRTTCLAFTFVILCGSHAELAFSQSRWPKNPFSEAGKWISLRQAKSASASVTTPPAQEMGTGIIDSKRSQIELLMAMGESHENRGDVPAAMQAYQEVLRQERNGEAFHRLAMLQYKQGDEKIAWENLNYALKLQGDNVELLADIGYLLYLSGDLQKAEQYTRKALKISPHNRRLQNNLGLLLVALERPEEALDAFHKASNEKNVAYANAGHACLLMEQYDVAEQYLDAATKGKTPSSQAAESLVLLRKHSPHSSGLSPIVRAVSYSR